MVRNAIFTSDDIVAAAVKVVARSGVEGLSARNVADELDASTAPVYSNFTSMAELLRAVEQAVAQTMLDFTDLHFCDDEFLNVGLGVLEFARQHPHLYSAIFMQASCADGAGELVMASLAERLATLACLADLPEDERLWLLHQMSVFTHGLAVQICTGLKGPRTFADLVLFLEEAGRAMVGHALSRPSRTPAQTALMQSLLAQQAKEKPSYD